MDIVVCVKQVPDTAEIKLDPTTNTLIRHGLPSIVNPFDKNALEAALILKEKLGGKVTVLSMGPPQAKNALKECLTMGADEAVLVSDPAFAGADTFATSYTLAAAIKKIATVDLIVCGKQSIDGDTAQVGPEIAEHLGLPQITYVAKIDVNGNTVTVEREHEDSYEIIEAKTPLLLTVVRSINEPRMPSIKNIMKASRQEIPTWTLNDLGIDPERTGLKGSPTQVRKIFTPPLRTGGQIIRQSSSQTAVTMLIQKLKEAKIFSGGLL